MANVLYFKPRVAYGLSTDQGLQKAQSCKVIHFQKSRAFAMARLHREILNTNPERIHFRGGQIRKFIQTFCQEIRLSSGYSRADLSAKLNDHPNIQAMNSLPGAKHYFPITKEFLSDLESNIFKIIEYNPYCMGFLGLGTIGLPTMRIAEAIAQICDANRDFRRFEKWCYDYERAECEQGQQLH